VIKILLKVMVKKRVYLGITYLPIIVQLMVSYFETGLKKGYIRLDKGSERITYITNQKVYSFSNPEEKVRAAFYVELIEKYQYNPECIDLEVIVPRRTPHDLADIVVFRDKSHKTPFIVIECKRENISKPEENQAIEQAFGNAHSLKANYTAVVSGSIRYFYDVANFPARERTKNIIAELPINFGKPQEWNFRKGDPLWDLHLADTFQLISNFSNCHDIIWEGGKKNPAEAFDEMSKLMFCKIRDERDCRKGEFYRFQIKTHEEPRQVAKRIRDIYNNAKEKDPEVFKAKIELEDSIIYNVVLKMQSISLSRSDIDSKGRAFETFMGKIFRGELGQFFTPRQIVKFMVYMTEPTSEDIIMDPSCGSGGFLLHSLDYVREELYSNLDEKEAYRAEVDFVRYNLYGIEINHQIARVAMMDMILHEDGHTNIEQGDGLDNIKNYNAKRDIKHGKYSIILQNPPFGYSIKKDEKDYFNEYELAENKNQISSQVLFIERAHKLLMPGGKMGIVVPDSITTNSTTQYVRDYIRKKFIILAIVSLPKETFMPSGTGVKTSLLFLRKKTEAVVRDEEMAISKIIAKLGHKMKKNDEESGKDKRKTTIKADKEEEEEIRKAAESEYYNSHSYPVFMAVAKHVGYDATGKPDKNDLYAVDAQEKILKDQGILGEYRRFKKKPATYPISTVLELIKDKI
jgi:type I restriction enzyme M protein